MRLFVASTLLLAAFAAPAAVASTQDCFWQSTLDLNACAYAQSYTWGSGSCTEGNYNEGGEVGAQVWTADGARGASVDNGCYARDNGDGSSFHGSVVGVSFFGANGDGLSRAHVNSGSQTDQAGNEQEYCHAGVFNGNGDYTRLANCPGGVAIPVVLTMLP